jgi:acyl-CoA thioesterase I
MNIINDNSVVLFQGDSVTDCGRIREIEGDLGQGYPMMIAAAFTALHPEKKVRFLNKGVSCDRVINLQERWQNDCIDLQPDVVSILIGINDTWRKFDSNDATAVEKFEKIYRDILTKVKVKLGAKIILCEPFLLPVMQGQEQWREDLDPKLQVVRKLAREFNTFLVPLDGAFAQASTRAESTVWTVDGVHPTQAGHALISKHWLETVGAI